MSVIYHEIEQILKNARNRAYSSVNFIMVEAYWNIGRVIVEEEQHGKKRAEYGKTLIKELSLKLSTEFGKGFDQSNLRYMRLFYKKFPNSDALRHKLSWTHYRLLLKIEKDCIRDFYIKESIENSWSTRQLNRQINSFYYERLLASKKKEPVKHEAITSEPSLKPDDVIKDPYVLEFLSLNENMNYLEKELEAALMDKLQEFLLELGKGFSFVGRQKRVSADMKHFYIDLVFYNYLLKCFVLIDLKSGELTHQDIGQMDFYVRYWEDQVRTETDNPTVGIILCTEKSDAIVKYSVLSESEQIFASNYQLYLPTEEELRLEILKERDLIELEMKLKDDENGKKSQ